MFAAQSVTIAAPAPAAPLPLLLTMFQFATSAAKVAALALALAQALQRRGVGERPATLAARTAMETFRYAAESWLADPAGGMGTHLERAFDELHDLSVAFSPKEARLALKAPASGRPGAGSTRR